MNWRRAPPWGPNANSRRGSLIVNAPGRIKPRRRCAHLRRLLMIAAPLTCPQCGQHQVFRSRCSTLLERLKSLAYISPFRCQACSYRFSASRWGYRYSHQVFDRREHLRIPVRLFLSFSGGKIRGEGTVLDISMGGCVIESQASVHVDDIFYLQIVLDNEQAPLEVAAMVRSVSSRGIAFKFLRSAQENKRLLAFVQSKTEPSGTHPSC